MSNVSAADRDRIAAAVRAEHADECGNNTCDITLACNGGFVLWAARLLVGATETPVLDRILAGVPGWSAGAEREVDAFATYMRRHTRRCPSCEAYVAVGAWGGNCGNCLAPVKGIAA